MRSARDEPAALGFELTRRFRASPERVFRAWTEPAALRGWWCPFGWIAGDIAIDLRVGGTFCISMVRAEGGDPVAVRGQFLEVEPPVRLVFTWRWDGAFPEMPETTVTLALRGSENETVLTLSHTNFTAPEPRQQHRTGWVIACNRLDRLVTPPAAE